MHNIIIPPLFALREYFVAIAEPISLRNKCSIPKVHVILNIIFILLIESDALI